MLSFYEFYQILNEFILLLKMPEAIEDENEEKEK